MDFSFECCLSTRALCESWPVPAFPLATGWECGAGKAGFLSPWALQDQARGGISGRTGLPLTGQQLFSRPWPWPSSPSSQSLMGSTLGNYLLPRMQQNETRGLWGARTGDHPKMTFSNPDQVSLYLGIGQQTQMGNPNPSSLCRHRIEKIPRALSANERCEMKFQVERRWRRKILWVCPEVPV